MKKVKFDTKDFKSFEIVENVVAVEDDDSDTVIERKYASLSLFYENGMVSVDRFLEPGEAQMIKEDIRNFAFERQIDMTMSDL